MHKKGLFDGSFVVPISPGVYRDAKNPLNFRLYDSYALLFVLVIISSSGGRDRISVEHIASSDSGFS